MAAAARAARLVRIAALASLAVLTLVPLHEARAADGAEAGLRIYRWVDAQGVTHYGDSVPALYADDARDVLNGQGVAIRHIAGLPSAAQRAAQDQLAQASAHREQHDQFLLTTYASAQEIARLRDERLGEVSAQIQAASSYVDSLTLRLAGLEERAEHFAPYSHDPGAPRLPDELAQDLVHTLDETRTQRAALDAKRQEQSDMRTQFAADLARYQELTAARAAGAAP
jgi:hypothetical protein